MQLCFYRRGFCHNTQVCDQLIIGLSSPELRRELLKESKLSLADAVSKAVALETSFADCKLYHETSVPGLSSVAAVTDRSEKRNTKNIKSCKYCGRSHTWGKSFRPAAQSRCPSYNKLGHFAAVCLSSGRSSYQKANAVEDTEEESACCVSYEYDSVYACTGHDGDYAKGVTTTLTVNGPQCEGLLDTGATCTIVTDDIVQPTRMSDRVLKAYNGGTIITLDMADITISSARRSMACACFVIPSGTQRVLFGQDVISELELLVSTNLVDTTPVSISVAAPATPVAQPARRPPFSAKVDIKEELQHLVKADVIEPVKEASPWVSPIVPVP